MGPDFRKSRPCTEHIATFCMVIISVPQLYCKEKASDSVDRDTLDTSNTKISLKRSLESFRDHMREYEGKWYKEARFQITLIS